MGAEDQCWPWTGGKDKDGYGVVVDDHGRQIGAHRAVYAASTGRPIPTGKQVLHTCDNPPCCNPRHLRVGSAADNNRDKAAKLRARSKLTPDDVRKIRKLLEDKVHKTTIAKMFGVSHGPIYGIANNEIWTHVV